jgi:hypothetical protein
MKIKSLKTKLRRLPAFVILPARLVLSIILFARGVYFFRKYGETPSSSYIAMRNLYGLTNGRFNDVVNQIQSIRHPKYPQVIPNGVLGSLSKYEVEDIASQIKKHGYYVSDQKLDQDTVSKIVDFCKKTPSNYLEISPQSFQRLSDEKKIFDPINPVSPIYKFSAQQVFSNSNLCKLILDQSLLAVAQEYLNCSPVLDLVSLWWSAPFNLQGTSDAAQEYHYDMDRIKFLKVFIYLTDVDSENGPHCYVENSHWRKPKALLLDGRKTDEEIHGFYPDSRIQELQGSQGTIILADTRGFHKGKPLTGKYRLLFQLEYSNSLFGANYTKVRLSKLSNATELREFAIRYPRTYGQILTD